MRFSNGVSLEVIFANNWMNSFEEKFSAEAEMNSEKPKTLYKKPYLS